MAATQHHKAHRENYRNNTKYEYELCVVIMATDFDGQLVVDDFKHTQNGQFNGTGNSIIMKCPGTTVREKPREVPCDDRLLK